jgi:ACS family hexuronate transporter-like MFS transporter
VLSINVAWHGYRTWLPLYLLEQRGYTEAAMSRLTTLYYLMADIGAWTIGGLTLLLCRRGWHVAPARMLTMTIATSAALTTVTLPWLSAGWPLAIGLLLVAWGLMGTFPLYFAFSQDLSAQHQGKVSGLLGASAHLALAAIYPLEGGVIAWSGSYEPVLAVIGLTPGVACLILWLYWPRTPVSTPS